MFSKNLLDARLLARLSHRSLAEEIAARGHGKISHTTLWKIEGGSPCRENTRVIIARTFKDLGVVFTDSGLQLMPKVRRSIDGRILFTPARRKKVDICKQ